MQKNDFVRKRKPPIDSIEGTKEIVHNNAAANNASNAPNNNITILIPLNANQYDRTGWDNAKYAIAINTHCP